MKIGVTGDKYILFWNILMETPNCNFIILSNELLARFLSSVSGEVISVGNIVVNYRMMDLF